ncbi:MAG: hypothetical protein Q9187_003279 [Circinaria calcarea]
MAMMDEEEAGRSPFKRARLNDGSSRGVGPSGSPAAGPTSFAARMMAKMGHVQGQGLGATGRGRLAPIETQVRPQGAGLGTVKEKTRQAKEEEKREAAFRGEVLEDSSEEERKRRRKKKEDRIRGTSSGTSTPGGLKQKPKLKYRTAAEIEAAADGLQVPSVLKSIIDVTGKEARLLTSASGLLTPNESMVPSETDATKIAKRARRDLEAFADEWTALSDRKKFFELQSSQIIGEIDEQQGDIRRLQGIIDVVQKLQALSVDSNGIDDISSTWETITRRLESMEIDCREEIDTFALREVAVAAIHPLFRVAMQDWLPLENPTYLVAYLKRLYHIFGIDSDPDDSALTLQNDHYNPRSRHKSTTHYETMIYTLWLPQVRNAITNEWDVHNPAPLITLLQAWKPLLPPFILANVIDQLIIQRLNAAIAEWKPRTRKSQKPDSQPPHLWLFPWLQYLPDHHTDPTSPSGLLTDMKRRLRSVVSTWDLTAGIPPGLHHWRDVLRDELDALLLRHLLPRLARYLSDDFIVDPSEQVLDPYTTVLNWLPFFKPSTFAALLVAEFFPKWHDSLFQWLTSTDPEPNYDEIGQWLLWWQEQIPQEINTLPSVEAEWTKGLETINLALELQEEGLNVHRHLRPPAAGPTKPLLPSTPARSTNANQPIGPVTPKLPPPPETTFKDVVEDWCTENNLWMRALGEAHEQTGLPLYRITASPDGRGGVVAYLKGDVLWVRNKKDKGVWEPRGLDAGLVGVVEGV